MRRPLTKTRSRSRSKSKARKEKTRSRTSLSSLGGANELIFSAIVVIAGVDVKTKPRLKKELRQEDRRTQSEKEIRNKHDKKTDTLRQQAR
jgi:hypothetical protein